MKFRIEQNRDFILVGLNVEVAIDTVVKEFNDNVKKDASIVWQENAKVIEEMKQTASCKQYGLFSIAHDYNEERGTYHFMLAVVKDESTANLNDVEEIKLPNHTWIAFETTLKETDTVETVLPALYFEIYSDFLPSNKYEICDNYSFEIWPQSNNENGQYTFETWMPVKAL